MDRYPYHEYTILLGATRALAHIGVHFTHRVFGLSGILMDFMDNVTCRRKVIKDKGGGGKVFLNEEKWLK